MSFIDVLRDAASAAALPGARFVGASWRPDAEPAILARLRAAVAGWSIVEGASWLLASDRPAAIGRSGDVALAMAREQAFDRRAGTLPGPADLAGSVARDGQAALDGMAPPFRAAWTDRALDGLRAITDAVGLGHVFLGQADGVAVVASSATSAGEVLGAKLSLAALAGYAAFGNFIGAETPFEGVVRLEGGMAATLQDGVYATSSVRRAGSPVGASPAEALRATVAAMLRAAPDAELELSGGLDSRMILAAMPKAQRSGRSAITIGVSREASEDIDVARGIAEFEGLAWTVLDAGGVTALDADGLERLLYRAVAAYDHMANPLDKIALILAGAGRTVATRFGGQNGEIMRGFYYVGQPLDAKPTDALARRLIAWRLVTNDAVDPSLLAPAVSGELRKQAEARMLTRILSLEGRWSQVLDQFYLVQRMQNWVGNAAGNRTVQHVPLLPFFDAAYIAAAMATPAADKLNSRAAYRLLGELDPSLARRPLDGGLVPAAFPSTQLGQALYGAMRSLEKAAVRVTRKLQGGMPTLGSQTVGQHWRQLGLQQRLPLDRLSATGLFSEAGLERMSAEDWSPNRPTLGFVLMAASLGGREWDG